MSSGGMEWAYRMMGLHKLDGLGRSIIMHLGWRDHPSQRTDRAIAAAFGCDRTSIRRATSKLSEMGLIERAPNGCWVACETVAIVTGRPDAPSPGAAADGAGASSPRGPKAPGGRGPQAPKAGASSPPKRKENKRMAARGAPRLPVPPQGGGLAGLLPSLSAFQRSQIMAGRTVLVGAVQIVAGSPDMERLGLLLRSQERA